MRAFFRYAGLEGRLITAAVAILTLGAGQASLAEGPQLRAAWMHANYIKTRAEADRCIERIDRANLNAVFMLIWYWGGHAYCQSSLCPMADGIETGYDPLGYMIQECHRRKIEVHAWFVNGANGSEKPGAILGKHPDWAVDSRDPPDWASDGSPDTASPVQRLWYDFGKPEVRQFQSELMLDCLKRYDLDGIHLDYIRFGPKFCRCSHCQKEFTERYGVRLTSMGKAESLPIWMPVMANPVLEPTTATVVVEFSNGIPAITWNSCGKGKAMLLNWHAEWSMPGPVAQIVKRALASWAVASDRMFVTTTALTRERFGDAAVNDAVRTFGKLGCQPKPMTENDFPGLPSGSTVILVRSHNLKEPVTRQVEQFVENGGILVVVDGPVGCMHQPAMQRVLGMRKSGAWFKAMVTVRATGKSDLAPSSPARERDVEAERLAVGKWAEYRKDVVTELVRDVYRRAKAMKPRVQVTAAVFPSVNSPEDVYQDWPRWIREGIIDYVVPMAYDKRDSVLQANLADWKRVDPQLERILPGLGIFEDVAKNRQVTRDLSKILTQHRLCVEQGARGTSFFALDGLADNLVLLLDDPLIEALRTGPFKDRTPAYRPPDRRVGSR